MFCNEQAKVKLAHDAAYCKPLLCRSWTCEECSVTRAAALRFKAKAGNPDTFLTLTVDSTAYATPNEAAQALVAAWRLIRRRAISEAKRDPFKRQKPFGAYAPARNPHGRFGDATRRVELHDGKFPFIAFFEATQAGWPHLHILVRAKWVDQAWLSAQAAELLASPVVDVRRIKTQRGVARYVTKYLTKAIKRWGTLKRYYSSRGWDARPKMEPLEHPLPEVEWRTVNNTWQATLAWLVVKTRWAPEKVGPWWVLKPAQEVGARGGFGVSLRTAGRFAPS